jgi:hypothetical protein
MVRDQFMGCIWHRGPTSFDSTSQWTFASMEQRIEVPRSRNVANIVDQPS